MEDDQLQFDDFAFPAKLQKQLEASAKRAEAMLPRSATAEEVLKRARELNPRTWAKAKELYEHAAIKKNEASAVRESNRLTGSDDWRVVSSNTDGVVVSRRLKRSALFPEVHETTSHVRAIIIPPLCEPREIAIPRNDVRPIIAIVGGAVGMTPFDNCAGLFIFSNADGYKLGLTPNLKDSLGKVLPGNLIITRSDCGVGNLDAIENCFVQLSDDDVSLVTKWHSKCERLGAFEYPVPASLPGDESASR